MITGGYQIVKETIQVLKDEGKAITDLLIPRECAVCGRRLNVNEPFLCLYCEVDLPFTRYWMRQINPMSDKVNALLQRNLTDKIISEPDTNHTPLMAYSYATALFFYHGENRYRKIPQRLKYNGDIPEGQYYALMLGRFMKESPHFQDIDIIVPVPLHWTRKWNRGYNQAEIIAQALGNELGVPVRTDILERKKHTTTQTKLRVEDKAKNVNNAFSIKKKNENFNHVLIVDDVFTTGATACACINVMQQSYGTDKRYSVATLGFVNNG